MNPDTANSLIVILIFGFLNLLFFLNITNPLKVNRKANFWFGLFLLLWSTFWLDEISLLISGTEINTQFAVFIHFIQFFTPIFFYLSVVYFSSPDYKLQITDFKYLILPVVFLIFLLLQQTAKKDNLDLIQNILTGLLLIQAIFFTSLSYLKIRKHRKRILLFSSNTGDINLNWLEHIIFIILLMSIVSVFYNVFFNSLRLNVFINVVFLIVIFSIAYNSLKQKEIFPWNEIQRNEIILINEDEQSLDFKKKIISDEELIPLKSKLYLVMKQEKPYLDSELNLVKLAEILNITPHQLSYVINTGFNENFFQHINKYRVEKAKKLLVNEEMNNLSILGIAFESGFNSKTSFNTTFKKITTLTPSEFKKRSSNL
jgi:AraC-like DNA-binding protein